MKNPRLASVTRHLLASFSLLAVLISTSGCERKANQASPEANPQPVRPADGTAQLLPKAPVPRFSVTAREFTATSTTLTLVWPANSGAPSESPTLALCLPPNRAIKARWLSASLAGQPIEVRDPQRPHSGSEGQSIVDLAGAVEFSGYLRRWPIYRLNMRPEVFNPLRNDAAPQGVYELTLELSWAEPFDTHDATKLAESTLWRNVAERLVLDHESLDRYAVAQAPLPSDANESQEDPADPRIWAPGTHAWMRLETRQEGFVRLAMDDFLAMGLNPAQLKPEALRIFSHGAAVPVLIAPGPGLPASLPAGVYFWARPGEGHYGRERAYWLTFDATLPAVRPHTVALAQTTNTETIDSIGRTAVSDIDNSLVTRHGNFLAIESMDWVNQPVDSTDPIDVALQLPNYVADQSAPNSEAVFFLENEVALHQAELQVISPGSEPQRLKFFGSIDMKKNFQLPPGSVANDATTLTLKLSAPIPQQQEDANPNPLWLDRITVDYRATPHLINGHMTIATDVASTQTAWTPLPDLQMATPPALLALEVNPTSESLGVCPISPNKAGQPGLLWNREGGLRYEIYDVSMIPKAPAAEPVTFDDLRTMASPMDLVIITHREFRDSAEKLAAHRKARGTQTRVVDIEQIYNQFNGGELSPEAIRAFLIHALLSWPAGGPGAVILLGDCTSDYLNISRGEVKNWVPSYTYQSGSEGWASDFWMSRLAGDDDLGDIMLSRLSVSSREDAAAEVEKIIAYDDTPQAGPWRARLGFVADDGEFPAVLDSLRINSTPPAYDVRRIFLNELPLEDNWILPENYVERKRMKVSKTATEAILKTFREGVSFLSYYGHGSPNIWADERIWFGGNSKNSDNLFLANSGHPTFIANMTCNSGAIDYPSTPWNICITEDLMRVPNGGAIACYVPSGPGVTSIHQNMSKQLHRALFEDDARTLGEVIALTKTRYSLGQYPSEMVYMYHLLGDPLVDLQMTAETSAISLSKTEYAPGAMIDEVFWGMAFAEGQWQAELVDRDENTQWSSEPAAFSGGTIPLKIVLPGDIASGKYTLRIYLWNEKEHKDQAASGTLQILRPQVTIASAEPDRPEALSTQAMLSNNSAVESQGWAELLRIDGISTQSLVATTVTLAPQSTYLLGAEQSHDIDPPKPTAADAALSSPVWLEARFRSAYPADDTGAPATERRLFVEQLPAHYARFIASELRLEPNTLSRNTTLHIAAAIAPPYAPEYALELAGTTATLITTTSLTIQHGIGQTTLTLNSDELEKVRDGELRLTRRTQAGAAFETLDRIAFSAIPSAVPTLRFVPGSLRLQPENPSEGQTVFIYVEVENIGTAPAVNHQISLLDGAPQNGGRSAPDQMDRSRAMIENLGPGRRTAARLRWDPIRNAGKTPLWLVVQDEGQARNKATDEETLPIEVTALSKAKFKLVHVSADASEEDRKAHRVQLKANVANQGQTAARHVMVSFFRSGIQNEENKLGEVEIAELPGESEKVAEFTWTYDPIRDMAKGTQLPQPTAQVWLKGSTQRVSSETPATATGSGSK